MPTTRLCYFFSISICLATPCGARGGAIPAFSWVRHFGTTNTDLAHGLAVDSVGDIYIVGETGGSMDGLAARGRDAFIRKFTSDGQDIWARQWRSLTAFEFDAGYAVAVDSLDRAWMVGTTTGDPLIETYASGRRGLVINYDSAGNIVLQRLLGSNPAENSMSEVTTDRLGNAFVVGSMGGNPNVSRNAGAANVFQFKAMGVTWSAEINSDKTDGGSSVAVDPSGALYVGGGTGGSIASNNFGSYDAFIRKFDATRNVQWTLQFGSTGPDSVSDLEIDPDGNLLVLALAADSFGGPSLGSRDLILRKYSPAGQLLWNTKFGTPMLDDPVDLDFDALGNIYVAGITWGNLGRPNLGERDGFIQKYDQTGKLIWTHQFGTPGYDTLSGIEVIAPGLLYATGSTFGSLNGQEMPGGGDSFLLKLVEVPEPSSQVMALVIASVLLYSRSSRRSCIWRS